MPLYEYSCRRCEARMEILQSLGAGAEGLQCSQCGAEDLTKEFSTFSGTVAGKSGADPSPMGGCCRGTPT